MDQAHQDQLLEVIAKSDEPRILVVGDVMLDRYLFGKVRKIAREAPVPVVDIVKERRILGGAANLANNLKALGAEPILVGVIGNDQHGIWIRDELRKQGIKSELILDESRPTTTKTRIVSQGQILLRLDSESTQELSSEIQSQLCSAIQDLDVDCIAISDYQKGTLTSEVINCISQIRSRNGLKVIADPKPKHFLEYKDMSLVKSNLQDAYAVTGINVINVTSLRNLGINLTHSLRSPAMITMGPKGSVLFHQNQLVRFHPISHSQRFDPTGVRDTMSAAIALGISAGADLIQAACLGVISAEIKGTKFGTNVITRDELRAGIQAMISKLRIQQEPLIR